MAVSIESMLEALEELLEEGVGVPLSGGKRFVDVEQARDIIDDIRINMPDTNIGDNVCDGIADAIKRHKKAGKKLLCGINLCLYSILLK